jgi:uncharacterized protein YjbI with pentapeptide repeats
MTEIIDSNQNTPESQPAKPVRTLEVLLELYQQGHRNFSGSDLRGVTVEMVDKEIKYLDLREIILTGSNLTAIIFSKSTSSFKVDLTGANLKDCNLKLANLSFCRLDQCNFSGSDLSGANLSNSSFRGSDFINVNLKNANLQHSDFTASDFTKVDFSGLCVSGTYTAANFTEANFHSASLLGIFNQANFSGCNLISASLSGQFLQANFRNSHLHTQNLENFNAQGADFSDADLQVTEISLNVNFKYCYYNSKTMFSENLDPIASGMEIIKGESESE